jgi:hypothetical protein
MTVFDIDAELQAVVRGFEAHGILYAICGGVAVAVHGHPRATTDIDLIVDPLALDDARAILRGLGYSLEAAPMSFASGIEVRRISRVEAGEIFTLDLIPVTDPIRDVWEHRIEVTWRGRPMRVVSREGLIAMKRLAGRSQDLADLEALGAGASDD